MNQECETYRSVKDSFWTDPMILDLLPEEKLFYLWLFTNRSVQICGCYQVSVRTIEYELNLSRDSVLQLISNFIELGRIRYSEVNKEIILLKWFKHNSGFFKVGNKNTRKAINIGVNQIKTEDFKDIVLGWMDNEEAPTPDNGKKEQALCKPLASPLPDKDKKEQAPCKPLTYNNNNNNNSNNNKEPSSSPDVKLTTELEQTADETAVMMTERFAIFEFRSAYHQATGELLPGGLNNQAQELCLRHPRDKLEAAFEQMALHGGKTFAYLAEVLKGKAKGVVEKKTKSEQRSDANVAAAQEALRLLEERKYGSGKETAGGTAGFSRNGGGGLAIEATAAVSAGVG